MKDYRAGATGIRPYTCAQVSQRSIGAQTILLTGMKTDWINRAARTVPRYTSYPTAAQFGDGVSEGDVRGWLSAVPSGEPVSVYVHIPFCEQLCWYCGCHTSIPNGYGRIGAYLETLNREIELWSDALGDSGGAGHIHLGGGSPNALNGPDLVDLLARLKRRFRARPDAEICVELDPRALTSGRIAALGTSGVTRASLGVQTLAPHVQEAVNRIQPASMISDAVQGLRAAGITAINMDLMYGLPGQTMEDIRTAAAFAAAEGASRIAVFGYAHVPWFARHQKAIPGSALPGPEARAEQAEETARILCNSGYVRIGLDHFARPDDPMAMAAHKGTLRRNFQGYTTDPHRTLVGIGESSISAFAGGMMQNAKNVRDWRQSVSAGQLPVRRGVILTDEDRLRARAIEALMCNLTIDTQAICTEMGQAPDALDESIALARPLAEEGICKIEGSGLTVQEAARPLMRLVAQCFDAHFQPAAAPGRHALAV